MHAKFLTLVAFSVLCQAIDVTAGTNLISRCGQVDRSPIASCDIRLSIPAKIERISVTKAGEKKDRIIDSRIFPDLESETATLIIVDRNHRIGEQAMQVIREEIQSIFVNAVSPKRLIGLASFSDDLKLHAPVGSERPELSNALNLLQADSNFSNINRSAISAISYLSRSPAKRKQLIVISNGINQGNDFSASDVVFKARDAQVSVHGLGFVERLSRSAKLQGLRRIANETNGIFVRANLSDKRLPLEFSKRYFDTIESGAVVSISTDHKNETQSYLLSVSLSSGKTIKKDVRFAVSNLPKPSFFNRWIGIKNNFDMGLIVLIAWLGVSALALFLFWRRKKRTVADSGSRHQKNSTEITEVPSNRQSSRILPESAGNLAKLENSVVLEAGPTIPRASGPRFVHADNQDQVWHITEGNIQIGRAEDNDIRISDPTVHRHHAVVVRGPEGNMLITDISGFEGNGVYVNDERIIHKELQSGDLLEFGAVHLVYLTGISNSTTDKDNIDSGQIGPNSISPAKLGIRQSTEPKPTNF